jgi:hypothetical protein
MKKYWKFNLHLCQEQLRNVRLSQFSSCFPWDDWLCESYTSYTTINYTCFESWKLSPQHSILWFCNIRAVKKQIQFLTCTYLAKRLRELSSTKTGSYPHEFVCKTNCSACADYQPWYKYMYNVYENQRLPGKWHSLPGLQMVSNSSIYGSLVWIKKGSFLLNLQPKNEFQTTTKYERHDIAERNTAKVLHQSINQSINQPINQTTRHITFEVSYLNRYLSQLMS